MDCNLGSIIWGSKGDARSVDYSSHDIAEPDPIPKPFLQPRRPSLFHAWLLLQHKIRRLLDPES